MTDGLRAVLAGCGAMAGHWLEAVRSVPEVEVVGLVDLSAEAARKRAEEWAPDAVVETDLARAIERTRAEAVFDCTIPEAHADVALTAFAHGCHVLGEKPLADSMEQARRMVAAAKSAGRVHAVIQNRRYDPHIRGVRQFLESQAIGALTGLNADFYIGPHFGGFRDQMRHVLLLDMAIHTFDSARFLSGADPGAVSCLEWNPAGSWFAHGACAAAIFEMTGGIVFNYRGSWCAEGLATTWESDWRILGTRGSARWDGGGSLTAEAVVESGGFRSRCEPVAAGVLAPITMELSGHAALIREFAQCVRTGGTPGTNSADNLKTLAMVFGAIESAETGRRVELFSL